MSLPPIKVIDYKIKHFPTQWQAVIFRNYGMVPAENIAKAIKCDVKTLLREAERLGFKSQPSDFSDWRKKGYITLIKSNWHICTYEQIETLLDIDEKELAFILKEDDFLDLKLGGFKPFVEPPSYTPLDENQIRLTKKIARTVTENFINEKIPPFDFYRGGDTRYEKSRELKIIYSYSASYGDFLIDETIDNFPDALLKKYSELGINGIWFQALLSKLSYYPFDESLCAGYEKRRENLKKLIAKCDKYNIKLFLYFNEPRSLPDSAFANFANLAGHKENGYTALCTQKQEIKDYIYEAFKNFLSDVKGLGGIITITLSENLTNCVSHSDTNCSTCADIPEYEIVSQVNNIINRAIKDSGGDAKLIAYLWGWTSHMGLNDTFRGIDLLEDDILLMCVSEDRLAIEKHGIKNKVIDYSISNPGPSENTSEIIKYAKKRGRSVLAKIQANNSWECAVVPYIPVFELVEKHYKNLKETGTEGLMLSWTMGGYPSVTLGLLSCLDNGMSLDDWYVLTYKADAQTVKNAVAKFCASFQKLPFDVTFLYYGPQHMCAANLFFLQKQNVFSTMCGFPYDNIDRWRGIYPESTFYGGIKDMLEGWKEGLEILNSIIKSTKKIIELKQVSQVFYLCYKSVYNQYLFTKEKIKQNPDRKKLSEIINSEFACAKELYRLQCENPAIGFEAGNHYFFNENMLLEKLVNLKALLRKL